MIPIIDNAIGLVKGVIDKIFPDKTRALEAKAKIDELEASGELAEIVGHYLTTANEAASSDKWTSRARPSIIYYVVLYAILAVPFGVLYVYYPLTCDRIIKGMQLWFNAIPAYIEYSFLGIAGGYVVLRSVIDKRYH